jgi:hypothetical protein
MNGISPCNMRILIYEAIPDINRAPLFADMAIKLERQGHEVLLLLEEKLIYTLHNRLTKQGVINCQNTIANYIAYAQLNYTILPTPTNAYKGITNANLEASLKVISDARSSYYSEVITSFAADATFIWNGNAAYQSDFIHIMRLLDKKIIFIEHGWFPQSETLYIDPMGVNGASLLSQKTPSPLTEDQTQKIEQWREKQSRDSSNTYQRENHIFIPLQVDSDTNISLFSPFDTMREFIIFMENWLPANYSATFRPHPLGNYNYRLESKRDNFRFDSSTAIEKLIAESSETIGINSTVLLQSIAIGKPTSAFGSGVFSNSGCIRILTKADGFEENFQTEEKSINSFLYLLIFQQQIKIGQYANLLKDISETSLQTTGISPIPYNQYSISTVFLRKIFHIVKRTLFL